MNKIKKQFRKVKGNFSKKTIRQRIHICIGISLLLIFLFFIIKGNFFDAGKMPASEMSQSADSGEGSDNSAEEQGTQVSGNKIRFHINWIDLGVLAALCTIYGVHKYREKKREKRL